MKLFKRKILQGQCSGVFPSAISPFLRPVCFSCLSDLPFCPECFFLPCCPQPPLAPLQLSHKHHALQRGTLFLALLGEAETTPSAIVDEQKCFQQNCLKIGTNICWISKNLRSPFHSADFQREESLLYSKTLTKGWYSNYWLLFFMGIWFSLLPFFPHRYWKKSKINKQKYRRFLKH